MKKINILFLLTAAVVTFASCNKFLEEDPKGDLTANKVYSTIEGYKELITSCYSGVGSVGTPDDVGTDIASTRFSDNSGINEYNPANLSSSNNTGGHWGLFSSIAYCNTAVTRAKNLEDQYPEEIKVLKAEAIFLRSLYYFRLVQEYGALPWHDEEVLAPEMEPVKATEAEIYANLIENLEGIKDDLPKLSALSKNDKGRANWEACRQLLAEVYLTRGWNYNGKLGAEGTDFAKAAAYADDVINSMGAITLSPAQRLADENSETIFATRYGGGKYGQNYSGHYTTAYNGELLYGVPTGRGGWIGVADDGNVATKFLCGLYHPELRGFDKRYDDFFMGIYPAEIEQTTPSGIVVKEGDWVIYCPGVEEGDKYYEDGAWKTFKSEDVLAMYPNCHIYTPHMYEDGSMVDSQYGWITMTKYFVPYSEHNEIDVPFMRLAHTYLTSAEAHLKAGDKDVAAQRYMAVRNASVDLSKTPDGVDPEARTGADITIDDILDELGRETIGEGHRWFDLKRTHTLYERTIAHNVKAAKAGFLASDKTDKYYLRPIPVYMHESTTNGFAQNPGWDWN